MLVEQYARKRCWAALFDLLCRLLQAEACSEVARLESLQLTVERGDVARWCRKHTLGIGQLTQLVAAVVGEARRIFSVFVFFGAVTEMSFADDYTASSCRIPGKLLHRRVLIR